MGAQLAYAQARLQARHGEILDSPGWGHLHGIREFTAFLENARSTSLGRWLQPFNAQSGAHELEVGLREAFRAHAREVAGWLPQAWRGAVHWVGLLPDLPALQHLLTGQSALPWMRADPSLERLLSEGGALRPEALREGDWACLAAAWDAGVELREAWTAEWVRRWPQGSQRSAVALDRLQRLVQRHTAALLARGSAHAAWEARRGLAAALAYQFRRQFMQPAAAFVHLLRVALELERLRAELVARRILGVPPEL
jgi:hypothetical protein